ncbi:hypothetical protein OEZ86_011067 [Tetradesmus obliquus]|nr:hypothetical protein OEZ86_011067 [Tetradesmus obliquus]
MDSLVEQQQEPEEAHASVPLNDNATAGVAAVGSPAILGGLEQSQEAATAASLDGPYQTIACLGSVAPDAELASCSNSSGEHVLLLKLPREQLQDLPDLQRLVQQSVLLRHPGVLRVRELHLAPGHLVVVLESCAALSLVQYLQQRRQQGRQLSEAAARCLFQQVLLAVDYCHSQGLAGLPIQHTLLQERNGQPPLPKAAPPQMQLELPQQGLACCTLASWLQAQPHCSRGLGLLGDGWQGAAPGAPWPCALQLLGEVAAALAALHVLQPPVAHCAVHSGTVHLLRDPQLVKNERPQEQPQEQQQQLSQLSWVGPWRHAVSSTRTLCHPLLTAPEVLQQGAPFSAATDVFGLGVLMLQLAACWVPAEHDIGSAEQLSDVQDSLQLLNENGTLLQALEQQQQQQQQRWDAWKRQLPEGYWQLMSSCCSSSARDRPSASAALERLRALHNAASKDAAGDLDQSQEAANTACWDGSYQTIACLNSIAPGAELASCSNSAGGGEHVLLLKLRREQLQDLPDLQHLVQQSVLLRHPGVLRVRELQLAPGHLVVVLESCAALSLVQYLQQRRQQGRQLNEAAARGLFQQVLLAVDYCHSQGLAGLPIQHTLLQERNGRPPLLKVPCPVFGLAHSRSSNTAVQGRLDDIHACGQLLLQLLGGQVATADISSSSSSGGGSSGGGSSGSSGSSQAVIQLPKGRSAACQELLQLLLGNNPARMPCSVQGILGSRWFEQQQQDTSGLLVQQDMAVEQQLCTQTQEQLDSIVSETEALSSKPPPPALLSAMRQLTTAASPGSKWLVPVQALCLQPPLLLQAAPPKLQLPQQGPMRCTLAAWLQTQQHCSSGLSLFCDGWQAAAPGAPWPCALQLLCDVAAALAALHCLQPPVAHGAVHAGVVHLLREPHSLANKQQQQQQQQEELQQQEQQLAQLSWSAGGLAALVQRIHNSTDPAEKQEVVSVLRNVAGSGDAAAVCYHGGVAALVQLLRSSEDAAVQEAAARAVASVAKGAAAGWAAVCDAGGVAALVQLMGSSTNPAVQRATAWALGSVADSCVAGQAEVCDAGGVVALVELLNSSTDAAVQRTAAGALVDVQCDYAAGQAAVCDAGGVTALVQLLGSCRDAEVQREAGWALRTVAACKAAKCDAGSIAAVVQLLSSSTDTIVQQEAAWALVIVAEGDPAGQAAVLNAGGVPALVQLLCRSTETAVQREAARALGSIAEGNATGQAAVCDAGGVRALVQLLNSSTDTVLQQEAAAALRNVADGDAACKAAVCNAGGVKALVQLLGYSTDAALQREAVWALVNVQCDYTAGQAAVCDAGGVTALVQLLGSCGDAEVQQEVGSALRTVAACKAAKCDAGGVAALVQLLCSTTDTAVQREAAWSLATVAKDDAVGQAAVCNAGGVAALVQLLGSSADAAVQQMAAKALGSIAEGDTACKAAVCHAGGVAALVQILDSRTDAAVQQEAAWALGSIAAGAAACKELICDAGGVEALLGCLLEHSGTWLRLEALRALGNVCSGTPANRERVLLAVDYCHSQGLAGLLIQHTLLQERDGRPPLPKAAPPPLQLPQQQNPTRCTLGAWLQTQQHCSRGLSLLGDGWQGAGMPWPCALQLLTEVAAALAALHGLQPPVAHCAVHAGTVHLLRDPQPVTSEQPQAQQQQQQQQQQEQLAQLSWVGPWRHAVSGTSTLCHPLLTAPEVLQQGAPFSAATDVFGLGVLMLQLAACWVPAEHDIGSAEQLSDVQHSLQLLDEHGTLLQALEQQQQQQQQQWDAWQQRLPEGYWQLMSSCCSSSAADRPSAAAALDKLRAMHVVQSAGGMAALVQGLLNSDNTAAQEAAVSALCNVACGDAADQAAVCDAGGVAALVRLLGIGIDAAVQQAAIRALGGIAEGDAACRAAMVDAGAVPALVQLEQSSADAAVQQAAAWALSIVAADQAACHAHMQLLGTSTDAAVQQPAAPVLRIVGEISAACHKVVRLLMGSTYAAVQRAAAWSLGKTAACGEAACKAAVHCAGSVAALVGSSAHAASQLVAWILCCSPTLLLWILKFTPVCNPASTADTAAVEAVVRHAGGVPALVQLLSSSTDALQQHIAAWALNGLACDTAGKAAVCDAGGVPVLVHLLGSSTDVYIQRNAVRALGNVAAGDAACRAAVCDAGGVPVLVHLLGSSTDVYIQRNAVRALGNVAAGDAACRAAVCDAGGVAALVQLLGGSTDRCIRRNAAWALAIVAAGDAVCRAAVCGAAGVAALVQLLVSSKEAFIQQIATSALCNVANGNAACKAAVCDAGGVAALVQLLSSSTDTTVQRNSAWALCNVANGDAACKAAVCDAGGVAALVQLLGGSADAEVQQNAARALGVVAGGDAAGQAAVMDAGGVAALAQVLGSSTDEAVQQEAHDALHRMDAVNAACQALVQAVLLPSSCTDHSKQQAAAMALRTIVEVDPWARAAACSAAVCRAGDAPALVQLLSNSADAAVQRDAVEALSSIAKAGDAGKAAVCDAGGVAALVQLLGSSTDKAVQYAAALALRHLDAVDAACQALVQAMLLPSSCTDHSVQQAAASILGIIAELWHESTACTAAVCNAGGVPALVQLLSNSTDLVVQREAARALGNVAFCDAGRAAVCDAGGVAALVQLLGSSTDAAVQQKAAYALGNVAEEYAAGKAAVCDAGGVAALVQLLGGSADADVQQNAARALGVVAGGDAAGQAAVMDAGGVAALVQVLGSSTDEEVQQEAHDALHRLDAVNAACQALVQAVLLPSSCTDHSKQQAAAMALRTIVEVDPWARSAACSAAVCRAGGVPALVQLLSNSADAEVQRDAARALSSIAKAGDAGKAAVCDAGGVAALVQLLGSSTNESVQYDAALALRHLDAVDAACQALVQAVLLPSSCTDHSVQQAAASALRIIAGWWHESTACTAAVCNAGGVPALVQLLSNSTDLVVQREAARALGNVAVCDAGRAAVCDAGGVAALVQLLGSSTDAAVQGAAYALGNVAEEYAAGKAAVCDAGGVAALVQLLRSSNAFTIEHAARALGIIAEGDAACTAAVVDAGGVEALVRILGCSYSWSQLEALRALGIVCSGSPAGRDRVRAAGGEAVLRQLLQSNTDSVQLEAAHTLELLASSCDSGGAGPSCGTVQRKVVTSQRKVVSEGVLASLPCLRRPVSLRHECCSICHDPYKGDAKVATLFCSHQFHQECITRWLGDFSASCPMCRQDVEEQAQVHLDMQQQQQLCR